MLGSYWEYVGAGVLGFLGMFLLLLGVVKSTNLSKASILGFLGAILVWTGWIEFSFVWIAQKLGIAPLYKGDEIVTKPEYLVMMSSIGLLGFVLIFYLFSRNNCLFFIQLQKWLGIKRFMQGRKVEKKPVALTAFMETIVIIWFFYLVLLFVYDEQLAGDSHWLTHFVAWGSLLWSLFLTTRLFRIVQFDYAIRYAIPTVVIFWNVVEIMGRWGILEEIWVQPVQYAFEISLFFLSLILLLWFFWKNPYFSKREFRTK
jgi:hypothetical protein